jgi:RNA polymerase sigma-70 factor (ECF subfamily)
MQTALQNIDDAAVIELVLNGDADLFERLLVKYQTHVFSIVLNHVPRAHAEEVAHETFIRAYKSLANYGRKSPFDHWLARIAVRCCYDFWRQQKRAREIPITALSEQHMEWIDRTRAADSREAFDAQTAGREAAEILDWALALLEPGDRMVLVLVHRDGHSVRETADLLGWSVAKVKIQAYRSRLALRRIIRRRLNHEDKH